MNFKHLLVFMRTYRQAISEWEARDCLEFKVANKLIVIYTIAAAVDIPSTLNLALHRHLLLCVCVCVCVSLLVIGNCSECRVSTEI